MSKLASSIVLVIGSTGNVGSGAVAHLLKAGATVIAPSRSAESLETLKAFVKSLNISTEKLTTIDGISASEEADVQKLKKFVEEKFKTVNHVICSSGPWWNTPPLHQLDYATFRKASAANIDAHFLVWSNFGPLLANQAGSSFTFVNGMAADMPGAGLTSFTANAVRGLVAVVNFQTKGLPVRTNEMLLAARVESDKDFEEKKMTATPTLTKSSVFGKLFPSLLVSSHKSETIVVKTTVDVDAIVAANPI
ncbi:Outer membrane efflux protein [Phlyctochytrium planicorne]|nr:Outer membrane efflux protein [Phlyctochytrium planicorne]